MYKLKSEILFPFPGIRKYYKDRVQRYVYTFKFQHRISKSYNIEQPKKE